MTIKTQAFLQGYLHEKTGEDTPNDNKLHGIGAGVNRHYDEFIRAQRQPVSFTRAYDKDSLFMRDMDSFIKGTDPSSPHMRQQELHRIKYRNQEQKKQWKRQEQQRKWQEQQRKLNRARQFFLPSPEDLQKRLDRLQQQPSDDRNSTRNRWRRIGTTHPGSVMGYKGQDFTESPLS